MSYCGGDYGNESLIAIKLKLYLLLTFDSSASVSTPCNLDVGLWILCVLIKSINSIDRQHGDYEVVSGVSVCVSKPLDSATVLLHFSGGMYSVCKDLNKQLIAEWLSFKTPKGHIVRLYGACSEL